MTNDELIKLEAGSWKPEELNIFTKSATANSLLEKINLAVF